MKKIIFIIIVIVVAGYILHSRFGVVFPDTKKLQGTVLEIKDDIQNSANNVSDEINKLTKDFTEKKEKIENTVTKVENVIDAVNELAE